MNISGIGGIVTVLLLIAIAILLGSPLVLFINIPSAVLVTGLALGLQWATVGGSGLLHSIQAFRVFLIEVRATSLRREDAEILRGLTRHLYAASAIGALIGLVQILANLDDPSQLGPAMGVALLAPFYATVLSECIVRPCADRIEYLLACDGRAE